MSCFDPVWRDDSRALILGSYPSPASFACGFYYGHPHNRFWPMLARLLGEQVPATVEEKRALLLQNHIALWDVLQSCQREGAADTAIRSPVPNDIAALTAGTQIRALFFNGTKAETLYRRCCTPTALPSFRMPSTSPANAAWRMDALLSSWAAILPCLGKP